MSNHLPDVSPEHIINVLQDFINCNAGDEATEDILVCLGSQIFDISEDKMLEMLDVDIDIE